jgi:hypothetical protein
MFEYSTLENNLNKVSPQNTTEDMWSPEFNNAAINIRQPFQKQRQNQQLSLPFTFPQTH